MKKTNKKKTWDLRLRSKKTWLSQSTYACIKVLTKSTRKKIAGEAVQIIFVWCNAARSFVAFNVMVFPPEAETREDSTSSQIPYYLRFWRILSSDWSETEQLFYSCMPWEGGRDWRREGGREDARLCPDSRLSLSVRWMKAHCRLWWEGFVVLCLLVIVNISFHMIWCDLIVWWV